MATAESSGGSPEKSPAAAGRSGGGGGGAADSYIGSLISLTSKSEIRYEGILYTINTEESSIGLRNVRSFGTEGRKKDGPQIPASDKIYEFILFRGSDIKDLQVKSPVQPAQPAPIHNDPAIIQSQYTRPALPSDPAQSQPSHFPTGGVQSQPSQFPTGPVQSRPPVPFQPPLYQPASSAGFQPWGPQNQPAPPVYWPGYYPPAPSAAFQLPQNPNQNPPSGGFQLGQNSNQNLPPPNGGFQLGQNPNPPTGGFQLGQNPNPPTAGFQLGQNPPTAGFQLGQNPPTGGFQLGQNPNFQMGQNQNPNFQLGQNQNFPTSGGFQLGQNPNLVRPPHGMPLQFPPNSMNLTPMNLPELPPLLQQTGTSTAGSVPVSGTETLTRPISGFSAPPFAASLSLEPIASAAVSLSSSKLTVPPPVETSVPLLTPGQLFQTSQAVPAPTVPVQNSEIGIVKSVEIVGDSMRENVNNNAELVELESEIVETKKSESKKDEPILPEPPVQVNDIKEPLLPSPVVPAPYKSGASHSYGHHNYNNNYRGRGRGRGPSAFSRQVTKFTEEFDFIAMNEKFNKDEVWGHLGKSKSHGEFDENEADESLDDDESEAAKQPVYVKDDFFDTLSCTSLDQNSKNGRPRFSEQMKLDTETFGNFPRHHRQMGMRGGGRAPRGGFSRGGYNNNYNNNYNNYNNNYTNNNSNRGGYNNRGGYGYNNNNGSGRGTRPVYTNHHEREEA